MILALPTLEFEYPLASRPEALPATAGVLPADEELRLLPAGVGDLKFFMACSGESPVPKYSMLPVGSSERSLSEAIGVGREPWEAEAPRERRPVMGGADVVVSEKWEVCFQLGLSASAICLVVGFLLGILD